MAEYLSDEAQEQEELEILGAAISTLSLVPVKSRDLRLFMVLAEIVAEKSTVPKTKESFTTFAEKLKQQGCI